MGVLMYLLTAGTHLYPLVTSLYIAGWWHDSHPSSGIPHQVMEEDRYRDFLIPKQAMVIANLWSVPIFNIIEH